MNSTIVQPQVSDFLKGHLKFAILKALEKEELHGYAIIKKIEELTKVWRPTTGSIYPMLAQMQKEELISAKEENGNGRKKKVYCLKKKGKLKLKEQEKMVLPIMKNMNQLFQKLAPKKEFGPEQLIELVSKEGFMKKEIIELKKNLVLLLVSSAKGKIGKTQQEKIKSKLSELNALLAETMQAKE